MRIGTLILPQCSHLKSLVTTVHGATKRCIRQCNPVKTMVRSELSAKEHSACLQKGALYSRERSSCLNGEKSIMAARVHDLKVYKKHSLSLNLYSRMLCLCVSTKYILYNHLAYFKAIRSLLLGTSLLEVGFSKNGK